MSSPSSDSSSPGFPPAHVGDRSLAYPESSFSMIEDVLEPDVAQLGVSSPMLRPPLSVNERGVSPTHPRSYPAFQNESLPSPIQAALRSPSNTIEQNNPSGYSLNTTRELAKPKTSSVGYECQPEVVTAVAIVAIKVQLLSVVIAGATRALLSIGVILELLGILLAICRTHNADNTQPRSTLAHLTLRMPTFLIFTGIVGLGAALVVETLQTSLGTAVTMSSFLIFGVILCISTLLHGLRTAERGESGMVIVHR